MLLSTVVVPESFSSAHFADPAYRVNMEVFLRGIDTNGIILVDSDERLYNKLCDQVEALASLGKGKATHALFEELLKKKRQKIVRFVTTDCSFNAAQQLADVSASIATTCKVDSLIVDATSRSRLATAVGTDVQVVSISDYSSSGVEAKRRKCVESLPRLDKMTVGQFENLIADATRYTRWLRFYDKQIGKGVSLSRFGRGMEKVLQIWIDNAYFPKDQLSVDVYTVVDESAYRKFEPSVAYSRVRDDLVESLSRKFQVQIRLFFKFDSKSMCHPRHLQTQSLAIMFEKGFDILNEDGTLCRTFMTAGGDFVEHLREFRQLPGYLPL